MNQFKPTIVLTAITTIVALLLVVTHTFTYVDTSGIITDKLMTACIEAMGEGEFVIVSDWQAEGYGIEKPDNVEKLIKKSDGYIAFEIITNGYSKNGLDLLVAMDSDGSVKAVSVVSVSDTPGLGTKVKDGVFLSQFSGKNIQLTAVKNQPKADDEVQAVTGATYSSKGVTEAVNIAVEVYSRLNVSV